MKFGVVVVLLLTVILVACSPLEQQARNTAAALGGVLVPAQAKYHDTCVADARQTICMTINKGVAAQNALITAVETYCGWSTTSPPTDPNAKCVPVKSAEQALTAAIANAAQMTTEVKGVL